MRVDNNNNANWQEKLFLQLNNFPTDKQGLHLKRKMDGCGLFVPKKKIAAFSGVPANETTIDNKPFCRAALCRDMENRKGQSEIRICAPGCVKTH